MIRQATINDLPHIARLGAQFHAQAGWDEIPYVAAECQAFLHNAMVSESFICLVSDNDGIDGMIAGVMSPVYFNWSHKSGEELFWWVSDSAPQMTGLRLLDAIEQEAKAKGCNSWQMKSLARLGGERMLKLYERKGYRASERTFIKELVSWP